MAGSVFCMDGHPAQSRQINPPYADKRLLDYFQQLLAVEPVFGENRKVLKINHAVIVQVARLAEK